MQTFLCFLFETNSTKQSHADAQLLAGEASLTYGSLAHSQKAETGGGVNVAD
jgi:hypothetical protein